MSARLEAAVMKAISVGRDDRFADVEELIYQIETGAPKTAARRPTPLLNRNPVRLWQIISVLLLTALLSVLLRRNKFLGLVVIGQTMAVAGGRLAAPAICCDLTGNIGGTTSVPMINLSGTGVRWPRKVAMQVQND
jgi:hypothetical protein